MKRKKEGKLVWMRADRERHCSVALREMKLHLEQEKEEVTWRWVRCGGSWEVRKPLKPSRGWVGLKPHCKPFFPLRQAELEGQDGTGLQGRTRGHFITESVCPEDGKRIILQTGFIGGDNSLAEPTVGKRHIGWGYNIASFTASNRLISSNVCVCVCACLWVCSEISGCVCMWVCQHEFVCGLCNSLLRVIQKSWVAIGTVTWLVLPLTGCIMRHQETILLI